MRDHHFVGQDMLYQKSRHIFAIKEKNNEIQ